MYIIVYNIYIYITDKNTSKIFKLQYDVQYLKVVFLEVTFLKASFLILISSIELNICCTCIHISHKHIQILILTARQDCKLRWNYKKNSTSMEAT